MEEYARKLILAGEISGFLHDLGKLHPGFADEYLDGGKKINKKIKEEFQKQTGIKDAHGAILEPERVYPDTGELADHPELSECLERLLNHPAWAEVLRLPEEWTQPGTVQVTGLGAPLRQHHVQKVRQHHVHKVGQADGFREDQYGFREDQLSLLGDLYAMGADIRDSALDKGSSGAAHSKQALAHAGIADSFGRPQRAYNPDTLRGLWAQVPETLKVLWRDGAWQDLAVTRRKLYDSVGALFREALGETRRPTHDVTLWHHGYSTASHFKAALAEGVLRRDFGRWQNDAGLFEVGQMGRVRFRLLGVRWNWRELTQQAFRPVTLVSLAERRVEVIAAIRALVEDSYPIGNVIYEDDDGVLILAPGFHEDAPEASERLFAEHVLDPLQDRLTQCIAGFGPGAAYRLHWSEPTLYLTDYAEALGFEETPRQRFAQAGEAALRALWQAAPRDYSGQQIHICPQCALRPAPAREFEAGESSLGQQGLCAFCEDLQSEDARRDRFGTAQKLFGFRPRTFNLQAIAQERGQGNRRVALISVRVDPEAIVSGNALVTQLARPAGVLDENRELRLSANGLGDWFQRLLEDLRQGNAARLKEFEPLKDEAGKRKESPATRQARGLIGDTYWLNPKDGRVGEGKLPARSLRIADEFYLRETRHLPKSLGLCRHDGDRLALFAQRKHASPARLQRLWDDLRKTWRALLAEIAGLTEGYLMPLSLDASGVRLLVTARDATEVIGAIHRHVGDRFNKVRGGLAPQVSCLVFHDKFPLYLGLDAVYRMEKRIPGIPHQVWTVERVEGDARQPDRPLGLHWRTPQGPVAWRVDLSTGDPARPDIWHPHVIRCQTTGGQDVTGPDRLTLMSDLRPGDRCLIPPATFDFLVLEGSARRYQIAYEEREEQLCRPHLVFGALGKPVGLLEQFDGLATLVARLLGTEKENGEGGWNSSQLKALQGQMIELYETWVRETPEALRETGRTAWRTHLEAMLDRYLPGQAQAPLRAEVLEAVLNGRFFDAVEWSAFITREADHAAA